jgi:hypothetical protein
LRKNEEIQVDKPRTIKRIKEETQNAYEARLSRHFIDLQKRAGSGQKFIKNILDTKEGRQLKEEWLKALDNGVEIYPKITLGGKMIDVYKFPYDMPTNERHKYIKLCGRSMESIVRRYSSYPPMRSSYGAKNNMKAHRAERNQWIKERNKMLRGRVAHAKRHEKIGREVGKKTFAGIKANPL